MQNSQTNTFLKGMNLDTAKEFVGTDQYTYAENVHINTDSLTTAGALQAYTNVTAIVDDNLKLDEWTVQGTTVGHIYKNGQKTNCLIALFKNKKSDKNKIQVFGVTEGSVKILWKVETSHIGFYEDNAKLINIYEDSTKSTVYINQEKSYIVSVNINNDEDSYESVTDFSIFPVCGALPPFKFHSVVSGNKLPCKVQYAYQLFDLNGRTTALSAISYAIPVGNDLNNNELNEPTNEGVCIRLDVDLQDYAYIRIFEINYNNFTQLPRVYVKDEIKLNNSNVENESFIYADINDQRISEYTLEEFQAIKNFSFKSDTIETKNNILFAAGITEDTWDIDFDARVYSADNAGVVRFKDIKGHEYEEDLVTIVDGITTDGKKQSIIPTDVVYNNPDPDVYKYNSLYGNTTNQVTLYDESANKIEGTSETIYPYGGAGTRVSYMFVRPLLYLAPNASGNTVDPAKNIRLISRDNNQNRFEDVKNISIISDQVDNEDWITTIQDTVDDKFQHTIKDITYADPYICANYTGFKQGECYTFGVIFYNKQHLPSPVHFIGTIHIPYFDHWVFGAVEGDLGNTHDLLATTVGIRFKLDFSGIDISEVTAYEIVRVQKTMDTRKVLMQGVVSRTRNYPITVTGGGESLGTSDMRATTYPTISARDTHLFRYDDADGYYCMDYLSGLWYSLISPEISINKENVKTALPLAKTLRPIQTLSSLICETSRNQYDLIKGVPFRAIYKHVSAMTVPGGAYTLNNVTYTHSGKAGIYVEALDDGDGWFVGFSSLSSWPEIGYGLFKFYIPGDWSTQKIEVSDKAFCATIPANQLGDSSTSYPVSINQVQFVNVTELYSGDGYHYNRDATSRIGVHANCVVLRLDEDIQIVNKRYTGKTGFELPMFLNWSKALTYCQKLDPLDGVKYLVSADDIDEPDDIRTDSRSTVLLAELHTGYQENLSNAMLSSLSYTSTGQYAKLEDAVSYINCFGGDTYVCIHKELWAGFGYDNEYTDDALKYKDCINIKYPVETRINLDRVTGPNYDTRQPNPMLTFEPGQLLEFGSQELPLNAYNDVYSAQEYNKMYTTRGAYEIDNQHIGNRIVASEVKSFGELSDSFQNFKIANYINVDGQYGNITNLVKYNDVLYYLQDTAFGTVAVNQRSVITDNNQTALLLGTGDILTRCDYISTFDGSRVINDPSICVTPSSLYWYDGAHNQIMVFNQGGLNSLSKVKLAQSYCRNTIQDGIVHTGYDHKYNEVWFCCNTPKDNSIAKSLIYSEQVQAFVGFYTKSMKHPQSLDTLSVAFTTVDDKNALIKFGTDTNYENNYKGLVNFIVNKDLVQSKTYDTIVITDSINIGKPDGITVACKTLRQGEASQQLIGYKEGVCYMPVGRDANKERMRDKTMSVQITFTDANFSIPSVSTIYRYSRI